ncbi:MAG: hypothetical protein V2J55_04020 [Candidatus Competibacteraceae bacterium]|jgi:hypothetical protein|nr:hypothetical protein [Candidatus Competibacteraceae bacterium]
MNDDLPMAAQSACSAYEQMKLTKQAHFAYMQQLTDKYQKYGQPNTEEATQLNELLQAHDAQVQRFRTALQELKESDSQAHAAFIAQIASNNTAAQQFAG